MMPLQIAGRQIKQLGANIGDVLAWDGSDWAPAVPGAASIPAGLIVMWSGLLANIPSGWALCDGTAGTPDLRDRFVRGAAAGADPGATGGTATHMHAGHSNHVVTQSANHVVAQPGAHSNHVVTQPANHVVTQPSAHSDHAVTQPGAHSNHVVTQPSDHASHTHDIASSLPTPDLFDDLLSATGVSGRTGGPSATLTHAGAAVDAHSAHAGTAVDVHSAHAGTAVDSHSGSSVDAHSAHSGTAVDSHSGVTIDSHSAHDSASLLPTYFALAYIMKT